MNRSTTKTKKKKGETKERSSNDGQVCKKCGKYNHEDDVQQEQKPLMFKKKSHLHRKNDFMWIGCTNCDDWYHQKCSGLEQFEYELYEHFHCPSCVPKIGPSIEYEKVAPHRLHWYDPEEKNLRKEVGSEKWIEEFRQWETQIRGPTGDDLTIVENGKEFFEQFEKDGGASGWTKAYLVREKSGLDMIVPDARTFNIETILEMTGMDYEVDTIDVYRQMTYSMKLSTFVRKMKEKVKDRRRIYNFLSLEFSDNPRLSAIAQPPKFIQDISMVDCLWPPKGSEKYKRMEEDLELMFEDEKPRVEQFFLAGMAGSYTDYHIDFGGSSVFYHVLHGEKIFYVVPPTEKNISEFQKFQINATGDEWFGDKVFDSVRRVVIKEGQTLLIPAGWIHAVLTPVDSLVFGGNFLHVGNIPMQLKIHKMENEVRKARHVDSKFYFPSFMYVHWYTARNDLLVKMELANLENENLEKTDPCSWNAISALLPELRVWRQEAEGGADTNNQGVLMAKLEKLYSTQTAIQASQKERKNGTKKRKSSKKGSESDEEYSPLKKKKASNKK